MIFGRKKDVDLRDLQRRGLIRIPKQDVELETDKNGFVDLSNTQQSPSSTVKDNLNSSEKETGFFNFFETASSTPSAQSPPTLEKENREITRKLEEMDNKLYKLEQRIELIERKVGVGSSSGYSWQ